MKKITLIFSLICLIIGLNINLLQADQWQNRSWKSNPKWSPRGDKICFVLTETNESWESHKKSLCVINDDGTNLKKLPDTYHVLNDNFYWSPNGNGIAFVKRGPSTDDSGVYVIGKSGSNLRQLAKIEYCHSQLSWSPDGKQIAFTKVSHSGIDNTPNLEEICLMGSNGVFRKLTNGSHPVWSPDGKQIAFTFEKMNGISSMGYTIGVVNVDEGTEYHFTAKEAWITELSPDDRICWLSDSSKFFFTSREYIFSINAKDSANRNLAVYNGVNEFSSDLSLFPDEKKLVFNNNFGICVMDLSHSRTYRSYGLNKTLEHTGAKISLKTIKNIGNNREDKHPSLSPDGKKIAFVRNGEIWTMNPDGSKQTQITTGETTEKIARK
ncbi:MAG: DPP IV N-terminal domain-containing protein [Candidatus Woesearchaeota archaeon]|nr:DPP IV N-terminal domain-containing protein [Candidatus Woesearchaeota archaeon]